MADEQAAANQDHGAAPYPQLLEAYIDLVVIERRAWASYKGPVGMLEDALKLTAACPSGPKLDALKRVVAAFEAETASSSDPLFRFNFPAAQPG